MSKQIDLSQLAVDRETPEVSSRSHPQHILTRYVLPIAILFGFAGVFAWELRDSLLSTKPVTVVPVLATRAEVQQSGTPLFQSAGWVEARPTPVVVTALTEGVVEQLLVVEGQEVKAGEPVARLIEADVKLVVANAEAEVKLRDADLTAVRSGLSAAKTNLTSPVRLEADLAEAEGVLAKIGTELATLPNQLKAAEAKEQLARFTLKSRAQAFADHAIPEIEYRQAESEANAASAAVEELKARGPALRRESEALTRKCDALRKRLNLKTEEIRQASESEANVQAAEARLRQAQVALDTARLRLERLIVRAPASGRVLALMARPGTRLMGSSWAPEASTVVTLYDPGRIQVRADVRLDDVPRLVSGQPIRIECPAVPGGPIDGEMLFATAITDIQKNTLQVKVSIKSPPPTLRPDMLVTVTFLAPETPSDKSASSERLRLFVPRQHIESGDDGSRVWVADQAGGKARLKKIKLGPGSLGDWVEVVEGLTPADKVIASGHEGLTDGQRITVTGEDSGISASVPTDHKSKPTRLPTGTPGPKDKK